MKKRLLFVMNRWNSVAGGIQTVNREIACAIAKLEPMIECVAVVMFATDEERAHAGKNKIRLVAGNDEADWSSTLLSPELENFSSEEVLAIVGHSYFSGEQAVMLRDRFFHRSKVIHFIHMSPIDTEAIKEYRHENYVQEREKRVAQERKIAERADYVVCIGPRLWRSMRDQLVARQNLQSVTRLDCGLKTPQPGEERIDPKRPTILCMGRTDSINIKGLDIFARFAGHLTKSYARNPAYDKLSGLPRFVVRGAKGGDAERLESHLKDLALEAGRCSADICVRPYTTKQEDLKADYRGASIFVMPSREEGFGLVACDAISMGVPVIISDASGLAEVIREMAMRHKMAIDDCIVSHDHETDKTALSYAMAAERVLFNRSEANNYAQLLRERLLPTCSWEAAARVVLELLNRDTHELSSHTPVKNRRGDEGDSNPAKDHCNQRMTGQPTVRFSLSEVNDYLTAISGALTRELNDVDQRIWEARKSSGVPIYATKHRIKSVESAYLKTKLKPQPTLGKYTDFGGIRVLCMFEQDIPLAHECILSSFYNADFLVLKEFKLFHWDHADLSHTTSCLLSSVPKLYPDFNASEELAPNDRGYRSVHYVFSKSFKGENWPLGYTNAKGREPDGLTIEVQLRTLWQDLWAELEHDLVYKGDASNEHIKKCFGVLARDLESKDRLLTHLNDVSRTDKLGHEKEVERGHIALHPFSCVYSITGSLSQSFSDQLDQYNEHLSTYSESTSSADYPDRHWFVRARELFDAIANMQEASLAEVRDWFAMEKAYWHYYDKQFNRALDTYDRVIKAKSPYSYLAHFRRGLIFRSQKLSISKVLDDFDKSEQLVDQLIATPDSSLKHRLNAAFVKSFISYVYWKSGKRFLDIYLRKAQLSVKDFHEYIQQLPNEANKLWLHVFLLNNLCWYTSEKQASLLQKATNENKDVVVDEINKLELANLAEEFRQLLCEIVNKNNGYNVNTDTSLGWWDTALFSYTTLARTALFQGNSTSSYSEQLKEIIQQQDQRLKNQELLNQMGHLRIKKFYDSIGCATDILTARGITQ